jgi:predicted secreted protein
MLLGALACLAYSLSHNLAYAQSEGKPNKSEPQQLVRLAHSESREVVQDWLRISLAVNQEGRNLAEVQGALKGVLATNLKLAKAKEKRGELEVQTGSFSVYPRYSGGNKADGWSGSAELVLEGTDVATISALAGQMQGMAITSTGFMLSPAQRKRIEGEITEQAVKGFRDKAAQVSRWFGAGGYTIADVQVGLEGGEMQPFRGAEMAMSAKSADSVPVEAGMSKVTVTVSGAIALR